MYTHTVCCRLTRTTLTPHVGDQHKGRDFVSCAAWLSPTLVCILAALVLQSNCDWATVTLGQWLIIVVQSCLVPQFNRWHVISDELGHYLGAWQFSFYFPFIMHSTGKWNFWVAACRFTHFLLFSLWHYFECLNFFLLQPFFWIIYKVHYFTAIPLKLSLSVF